MTRYYVEHTETFVVDADTEEDAIQIAKDGGGNRDDMEWYAWAPTEQEVV